MASPKTLELRARETALKLRSKGFYTAKGVGNAPPQRVLKAHVDQNWRNMLAQQQKAKQDADIAEALRRAGHAERTRAATVGEVDR